MTVEYPHVLSTVIRPEIVEPQGQSRVILILRHIFLITTARPDLPERKPTPYVDSTVTCSFRGPPFLCSSVHVKTSIFGYCTRDMKIGRVTFAHESVR